MDNNQKLISMIKELSSCDQILSYKLALYLLDLRRNYTNYLRNRTNEINNLKSGIYPLKKHTFRNKYKRMENFVWLCYIYQYLEQSNDNNYQIKTEILEETKNEISIVLKENLSMVVNEKYEDGAIDYDSELENLMSASCLYMSCYFPNNVNIKNMNTLISKIFKNCKDENGNKIGGKLRKKFENKKGEFCSAFVKNNNGLDCYVFCGGWDNEKYPNNLTKHLKLMKGIIEETVKEFFGRDITWCKRTENMRSYNFRYNDGKYTELGKMFDDLNKVKVERARCINKHFSCCERKVLPYFEDKKNVDLEIFVTFNPCSDCELAINEFLKENKGSKIKVIYDQKKDIEPHVKDCNLY